MQDFFKSFNHVKKLNAITNHGQVFNIQKLIKISLSLKLSEEFIKKFDFQQDRKIFEIDQICQLKQLIEDTGLDNFLIDLIERRCSLNAPLQEIFKKILLQESIIRENHIRIWRLLSDAVSLKNSHSSLYADLQRHFNSLYPDIQSVIQKDIMRTQGMKKVIEAKVQEQMF